MPSDTRKFTKVELQTYILILCANVDSEETEEEVNFIKSKVGAETYERIAAEFKEDSEDERFQKIDDNIQMHDYSHMELSELRKEMYEIFFSDCDFKIMERNLNRIMDNMLY